MSRLRKKEGILHQPSQGKRESSQDSSRPGRWPVRTDPASSSESKKSVQEPVLMTPPQAFPLQPAIHFPVLPRSDSRPRITRAMTAPAPSQEARRGRSRNFPLNLVQTQTPGSPRGRAAQVREGAEENRVCARPLGRSPLPSELFPNSKHMLGRGTLATPGKGEKPYVP